MRVLSVIEGYIFIASGSWRAQAEWKYCSTIGRNVENLKFIFPRKIRKRGWNIVWKHWTVVIEKTNYINNIDVLSKCFPYFDRSSFAYLIFGFTYILLLNSQFYDYSHIVISTAKLIFVAQVGLVRQPPSTILFITIAISYSLFI